MPHDGIHPPRHAIEMVLAPPGMKVDFGVDMNPNAVVVVPRAWVTPTATPFRSRLVNGRCLLAGPADCYGGSLGCERERERERATVPGPHAAG